MALLLIRPRTGGQPALHVRQTLLGARPLLARCARCAAPMPPDPVGQLERSRARPPSVLAAGVLARFALPMPPIRLPRGSRRAQRDASSASHHFEVPSSLATKAKNASS